MTPDQIVVVIEDDTLLRLQAAELFDLGGMTVESFETSAEAIAFVRANSSRVACIFTDLRLRRGSDDMDVVRFVSAALPEMKVVLTSGQISDRPSDLPANVRFLAKPWTRADVMNTIREANQISDPG